MSFTGLIDELNEHTIAQKVAIPHDEQRLRYRLDHNTVTDFDEFTQIIGGYYNHHFSHCFSSGGRLDPAEAASRAKALLEREYRRQNGDIVTAFNDAHLGTNGGLRSILDKIADGLKVQAVENYVRDVFDRHVAPSAWEQKVTIIRQFMAHCGNLLPSTFQTDQPERYAHNYQELIQSYLNGLKTTSSIFRRL